jgi:hypothetical protein
MILEKWYNHREHRETEESMFVIDEITARLVRLKHFLARLGDPKPPRSQWKEVDDLKMPETLGITRFMPIRAKSLSLSRFEAILAAVFV